MILPLFVREAPHPCVFSDGKAWFLWIPHHLQSCSDWILDYASRELHATPAFELKYTSIVIRAERPLWGCFDS